MSEEKFPSRRDGVHFWDCYDPDKAENWFKHCLEDFPIELDFIPEMAVDSPESFWLSDYVEAIEKWKSKWFSQFNKKGE